MPEGSRSPNVILTDRLHEDALVSVPAALAGKSGPFGHVLRVSIGDACSPAAEVPSGEHVLKAQ